MSEQQSTSDTPDTSVAFGASATGQMQSFSNHSLTVANSYVESVAPLVEDTTTSILPPCEADNLSSASVAQVIAQRLLSKE
jgi:hypothetical protein